MIRIKTTGGATPHTTQWTERGGQNVMIHAHTADANLSFDKYLSQLWRKVYISRTFSSKFLWKLQI